MSEIRQNFTGSDGEADAAWPLRPIARVRTCFGDKFAVPRQPGLVAAAWGTLEFFAEFRSPEAVRGLDGFSHLWLIFGFDRVPEGIWRPTVRPPRLGGEARVGVFASRSTFRPNRLGLSLVRLEGIDLGGPLAPILRLGGVDVVDGTPVFDVKPYLPYAEALPQARGGYANAPPRVVSVTVSNAAAKPFGALPERAREVILQALALDPRPATAGSDPERQFGAMLCGCDVKFRFFDEKCVVEAVIPGPDAS